MNPKTILHRLVVLIATMMSAIGANAQEAYACYTSGNTTLMVTGDRFLSPLGTKIVKKYLLS